MKLAAPLGSIARVGLLAACAAVVPIALPASTRGAPALELPESMRDAAYVGQETCLECHEDYSLGGAVHARIPEFRVSGVSDLGCESCHGPGSVHADSNEPDDILGGESPLGTQLCLQCHRSAEMHGWGSSQHAISDVGCTSCHAVHGDDTRGLLKAAQVDVCYGCHEDVRSQTYLPSRHPIREGKMVCTDCHHPHRGGLNVRFADERPNELCLRCHADKEGPYVFEHSPVVEDCGICHAPHGAVATPLLLQNEPFLCLQCHQTHFHATIPGIEGEFTSLDGYSGVSTRDGSKRSMLTKCSQCHTEVHGSDLPSQSISGEGSALTR
jgi:DmsE family decaheme c-type cytochrome